MTGTDSPIGLSDAYRPSTRCGVSRAGLCKSATQTRPTLH